MKKKRNGTERYGTGPKNKEYLLLQRSHMTDKKRSDPFRKVDGSEKLAVKRKDSALVLTTIFGAFGSILWTFFVQFVNEVLLKL